MPKIKAELMTTPIKFYLRQFVTKAGVEPMAIPSERSLCARFNVARGTVRDAICQLEEDEVLIRLPGRKGVFSNPLFHTSPIWTVGLIAHGNGGYASEFPFEVGILQSGFFPAMPRDSFFCNIMFPDRFPEEELFRFFSNQNLDAMVWFGPGEFYAGLIAGLRRNGTPLFTVNITKQMKFSLPDSPYDFYPEVTALDLVMRTVKEIAPKKALFCFQKDKRHFCLWGQRVVEEMDLPGIQKEIRHLDAVQTDQLGELLRADPEITVLYTVGNWYLRQTYIVEAIEKSGRRDLVIVLENNTSSIALKQKHPELDIRIIGSVFDKIRETGENAAKAIVQYFETKQQEKNG